MPKKQQEDEKIYNFIYKIKGQYAIIKLDNKFYDKIDLTELINRWIDDEVEYNDETGIIDDWYKNGFKHK